MKKILSSIFILVFCIYITGCKNNNKYIVLHTETYEVQYEIYENGCSKYNLGFSEESYYVIDNYDDYLMFCSSALAMKINPNIDELNTIDIVDGYLIGGASTKVEEFLQIINKCV